MNTVQEKQRGVGAGKAGVGGAEAGVTPKFLI